MAIIVTPAQCTWHQDHKPRALDTCPQCHIPLKLATCGSCENRFAIWVSDGDDIMDQTGAEWLRVLSYSLYWHTVCCLSCSLTGERTALGQSDPDAIRRWGDIDPDVFKPGEV